MWLGLLIAVVAVAGIGHWLYGQLQPTGTQAAPVATELSKPEASSARSQGRESTTGSSDSASTRSPGRSDTILTCTAVDGQVFYTNATRCEDADLDNRVNVVTTPSLPASRPDDCLGAQPGAAAVQGFLPVCREAFQQALEQERFLLELADPASSPAARRYCAYITEGVQAGCMATSDQFCFLHLCQALR